MGDLRRRRRAPHGSSVDQQLSPGVSIEARDTAAAAGFPGPFAILDIKLHDVCIELAADAFLDSRNPVRSWPEADVVTPALESAVGW